MRIALIGANGQLAHDLILTLNEDTVSKLTHRDIEVSQYESVKTVLEPLEPEVVINTAAYHRVDEAEEHPDLATKVNADGASNLARVCNNLNAALVHLSTDYVFSGKKGEPYIEADEVDPVNVYGSSKVAGELDIQLSWHRHFIVRTSGLYGLAGSSGKGGNFVETMLRLAESGKPIKVVDDQVLTPTSTKGLAQQIGVLIRTESYGLYHATCQGQCSWYEFALEIFRQKGLEPDVSPQTTAESGAKATRPSYSVLENKGLKTIGLDRLIPWEEALSVYLEERA